MVILASDMSPYTCNSAQVVVSVRVVNYVVYISVTLATCHKLGHDSTETPNTFIEIRDLPRAIVLHKHC